VVHRVGSPEAAVQVGLPCLRERIDLGPVGKRLDPEVGDRDGRPDRAEQPSVLAQGVATGAVERPDKTL